MAGSLRDQFLNAGLVNTKQAKKAQHEARKANKGKGATGGQGQGKGSSPAPQVAAQDRERQAKADRDRALNAELAQLRRTREIEAQVRQLIERHRIAYEEGDARFSFTDAEQSVVRTLALTEVVRGQVIAGEIAIVGVGSEAALVPAEIARRIQERGPGFVKNWAAGRGEDGGREDNPPADDADDPYAKYVVPDDLVW